MTEKRRKLMMQVGQEKARNAGAPGAPGAPGANPLTLTTNYSKHFMVEPQSDDNDDDVYAIYRVADLLTVQYTEGVTPDPVHISTTALDAAELVMRLDQLVDAIEEEPNFYKAPVETPGAVDVQ